MSDDGWYGVDLDGTLALYDHWRGPTHIGEPIMPMVLKVKQWLKAGQKVKIFTARVALADQRAICAEAIRQWTKEHIGVALESTHEKDFKMVALYDDRAIQVGHNTGLILGDEGVLP